MCKLKTVLVALCKKNHKLFPGNCSTVHTIFPFAIFKESENLLNSPQPVIATKCTTCGSFLSCLCLKSKLILQLAMFYLKATFYFSAVKMVSIELNI